MRPTDFNSIYAPVCTICFCLFLPYVFIGRSFEKKKFITVLAAGRFWHSADDDDSPDTDRTICRGLRETWLFRAIAEVSTHYGFGPFETERNVDLQEVLPVALAANDTIEVFIFRATLFRTMEIISHGRRVHVVILQYYRAPASILSAYTEQCITYTAPR